MPFHYLIGHGEELKSAKIITRTPIYFMTKQVVWTFRKFFFLQFDTKFASKQRKLAKIGTILWLLLSTQISQVWHTTRWDENAEYDMHGLERLLRVSATQCL